MREKLAGALFLFAASTIGCDQFLAVDGHVTNCSTGAPIVGARAMLKLVEGVSDAECETAYSDPNGNFTIALNEPPTASATLLLDKPTYAPLTRDLSKAPDERLNFCLEPKP